MSTILRPYATFALRSLIRRFIIEVPDNLDLSVFADDERDTKANSIQTVNGTFNRVQSGDHGSNGDCLVFDACAPPQLFKTGTLGIVRVGLFVIHTSDDCYRSEQMASRGNPRGLSKIIEAPRGEILQNDLDSHNHSAIFNEFSTRRRAVVGKCSKNGRCTTVGYLCWLES